MPEDWRTHRVGYLHRSIARWLAVLLAITPLSHLATAPGAHTAVAAAASWHGPGGPHPSSRGERSELGAGDSAPAGILPRLLHAEAAFASPPPKATLPDLHGPRAPLVPVATGSLEAMSATAFHRSSVGTARTPTGPPA